MFTIIRNYRTMFLGIIRNEFSSVELSGGPATVVKNRKIKENGLVPEEEVQLVKVQIEKEKKSVKEETQKSLKKLSKNIVGVEGKQIKDTFNTNISIVDYLNSKGEKSDRTSRGKLAEKHGIQNYKGTAKQNLQLLKILREAKTETEVKTEAKTEAKTIAETVVVAETETETETNAENINLSSTNLTDQLTKIGDFESFIESNFTKITLKTSLLSDNEKAMKKVSGQNVENDSVEMIYYISKDYENKFTDLSDSEQLDLINDLRSNNSKIKESEHTLVNGNKIKVKPVLTKTELLLAYSGLEGNTEIKAKSFETQEQAEDTMDSFNDTGIDLDDTSENLADKLVKSELKLVDLMKMLGIQVDSLSPELKETHDSLRSALIGNSFTKTEFKSESVEKFIKSLLESKENNTAFVINNEGIALNSDNIIAGGIIKGEIINLDGETNEMYYQMIDANEEFGFNENNLCPDELKGKSTELNGKIVSFDNDGNVFVSGEVKDGEFQLSDLIGDYDMKDGARDVIILALAVKVLGTPNITMPSITIPSISIPSISLDINLLNLTNAELTVLGSAIAGFGLGYIAASIVNYSEIRAGETLIKNNKLTDAFDEMNGNDEKLKDKVLSTTDNGFIDNLKDYKAYDMDAREGVNIYTSSEGNAYEFEYGEKEYTLNSLALDANGNVDTKYTILKNDDDKVVSLKDIEGSEAIIKILKGKALNENGNEITSVNDLSEDQKEELMDNFEEQLEKFSLGINDLKLDGVESSKKLDFINKLTDKNDRKIVELNDISYEDGTIKFDISSEGIGDYDVHENYEISANDVYDITNGKPDFNNSKFVNKLNLLITNRLREGDNENIVHEEVNDDSIVFE